ncbi:MAG: HAD family phosphatase [Deltaproteobacteria bacterium]|nr:HAD family phosphatase [Deltaproteobacteria bacterium]
MSALRAVIFDLDGTLIDSERRTLQAYVEAGRILGQDIGVDLMKSLIGRDARASQEILSKALRAGVTYEELCLRAREIQKSMPLDLKPGALEILQFVKDSGRGCGLATSTHVRHLEVILDSLELRRFFDVYVCGDQVTQGKPAPEIYLHAASKLAVAAHECVALEDSGPGMQAALAAGMRVIHIPDMLVLPEELQNRAHSVEPSLLEARATLELLLRNSDA